MLSIAFRTICLIVFGYSLGASMGISAGCFGAFFATFFGTLLFQAPLRAVSDKSITFNEKTYYRPRVEWLLFLGTVCVLVGMCSVVLIYNQDALGLIASGMILMDLCFKIKESQQAGLDCHYYRLCQIAGYMETAIPTAHDANKGE